MNTSHGPITTDEDGAVGKAFHRSGIPRGILINAEGEVTFDRTGYEIPDLRAAIAKLGTKSATIAPSDNKSREPVIAPP